MTTSPGDPGGLRPPWARTQRPLPRLVVRPVHDFLRTEAAGGLVLLAATIVALIWANLAGASYLELWGTEVTVRVGDHAITEDLQHVVNDGLMAIFFLVVGLEVKRELAVGELSSREAALLPLFAAIGGMVVPAAIFLAVMGGADGARGWGIPMATDIAFALGALAALGTRVPTALVAFLLGVAVIDDIGTIVVVAVYYTDAITLAWLAAAVAGLLLIVALQRVHVRALGVYVVVGVAVWFATFESGVHATVAGVAIGLLTPVRPFQRPAAVSAEAIRIAQATSDDPADPDEDAALWRRLAWFSRESVSPLTRVEHGLHRWSSFVVLPIFALANAGIVLDADALRSAADTPVAAAVALALVVGKTAGLTAGVALAVALGLSRLPPGVRWEHIVATGALAGIGFTVSLFITELAYSDPATVAAAKIGILGGSTVAAIAGIALLVVASRRGRGVTPGAPPPGP